ncbi:hypothetical protein [Methylogaea oryzae]|nr:hypothetical protein [Methylogaea oryzae]
MVARWWAVVALRAWLDAAGIVEGPVFRAIGKGGRGATPCRTSQWGNW